MNKDYFAHATDFVEQAAYYPDKRPGYTGWVSLFHFSKGEMGLAFNEIRAADNPGFCPTPLEEIEARAIHYRFMPSIYSNADSHTVTEYVYLKSPDSGKSWQVTGRCAAPYRHVHNVGYPDGRIVRAHSAGDLWKDVPYRERWSVVVEESRDGGTSWSELARPLEGAGYHHQRLKSLRDGTLIISGAITPTFGRGGYVSQRGSQVPGLREWYMPAFLASGDGGHNWSGPHYVLGGTEAHEYDFVELSDGRLLFFLSSVQANWPARQIVRRTGSGFINEPLMEVHRGAPTSREDMQGGITPETIVATSDDFLIGGRRGKPYVCSNDLGDNWFEIGDLPNARYQPMMELLSDGRVLMAWHHGADSSLGEYDMFIGTHCFRVVQNLPKATELVLERALSDDRKQYLNSFGATLSAEGKPLPGRTISLYVRTTWLPQPDGRMNPVDLWASPDVRTATTDAQGVARFHLTDKDEIVDIHHSYQVGAEFVPQADDRLAACRSATRSAYTMTQMRDDPNPYPLYLNHAWLMITPDTEARFPELARVVEAFCTADPDVSKQRWIDVVGEQSRAEEILAFLMEQHVITVDRKGLYHWYRAVHSGREGEPWIKGVRVCRLKEYCC